MGVVGVADRRPQHEAALLGDQLLQIGVAIIGGGFEVAAERGFRIVDHRREKEFAFEAHEERLVVGDEFGAERGDEQHQEDPQRPVAAPVRLEVLPSPQIDRRQRKAAARLPGTAGAAAIAVGGRWQCARPPHTSRVSKSMRGIDPGIGEIGEQVDHEAEQREDIERREHDGIVAVQHAFEAEQAEAVEREDGLDQQRAGEEDAHERAGKAGDDQQHGVAEDVAVEDLAVVAALGARGQDILLADLVEEAVLGEDRHGREGADAHREQRQRQVPEIVEDLLATTAASPNCRTSGRAAETGRETSRRRTGR